jgi:hypothetical protein
LENSNSTNTPNYRGGVEGGAEKVYYHYNGSQKRGLLIDFWPAIFY